MRVLSAVQRIIMLLLLIPVLIILLDTLLRAFDARESNPIVKGVRDAARVFIIEPFRTVFPDQSYLQNAAVTLAAIGLLVLVVVVVFGTLRSLGGTRKPKPRPAPAPKAAKTTEAAPAKTEPAKAEATSAPAAATSQTATTPGDGRTEAPVSSGTSSPDEGSHSTSG